MRYLYYKNENDFVNALSNKLPKHILKKLFNLGCRSEFDIETNNDSDIMGKGIGNATLITIRKSYPMREFKFEEVPLYKLSLTNTLLEKLEKDNLYSIGDILSNQLHLMKLLGCFEYGVLMFSIGIYYVEYDKCKNNYSVNYPMEYISRLDRLIKFMDSVDLNKFKQCVECLRGVYDNYVSMGYKSYKDLLPRFKMSVVFEDEFDIDKFVSTITTYKDAVEILNEVCLDLQYYISVSLNKVK